MHRLLAPILLCLLCFASPLHAQDEGSAEPVDSMDEVNAEGFQAAEGGGEEVDGGMLMIVAYGAFWVMVLGYVVFLVRKQGTVSGELLALNRRMEEMDDRLDEIDPSAE